jgi:hypothetical protein
LAQGQVDFTRSRRLYLDAGADVERTSKCLPPVGPKGGLIASTLYYGLSKRMLPYRRQTGSCAPSCGYFRVARDSLRVGKLKATRQDELARAGNKSVLLGRQLQGSVRA